MLAFKRSLFLGGRAPKVTLISSAIVIAHIIISSDQKS